MPKPTQGDNSQRTRPTRTAIVPRSGHRRRDRALRFTMPFLAVAGYYLVGVFSFAVMASSDAMSTGDLPFFLRYAALPTGPFALAAALAAGRWWC